jgi:hypothetical protein
MSKRMIESLDEDDDRKEQEPMPRQKKERKSYSNCFHATKSGMRCLNMQKYGFKIGKECYKFCVDHFDATLLKLFTMLLNPIEIPQETITGVQNILVKSESIECWNLDNTNKISEVYLDEFDEFRLQVQGVWGGYSSLSAFLAQMTPFLEEHNGFIIKWFGYSREKIDTGSFKNKVYGRFKDDLVVIPVDDGIELTQGNSGNIYSFEMEIQFM